MEPHGGDAGVQPNFGALQNALRDLRRAVLKLEDVAGETSTREDTRSASAFNEPSWL